MISAKTIYSEAQTLKLFDEIVMKEDNKEHGLVKGQTGYILEVYDNDNYEVEFSDENGNTIFLGALSRESIELKSK
jgi:hypothetical protein